MTCHDTASLAMTDMDRESELHLVAQLRAGDAAAFDMSMASSTPGC